MTYFLKISVLCLVLASCSSRSSEKRGLITKAGTYPSHDGKYALTVTVEPNADVKWTLRDVSNNNIRASGGGFSDSQRWFFFWDKADRLWMDNSDMGPFELRTHDANGRFSARQIRADSPEIRSIPSEVRGRLGSVRRRLLKLDVGGSQAHP